MSKENLERVAKITTSILLKEINLLEEALKEMRRRIAALEKTTGTQTNSR